jgi:hypothetical protein
LSNELQVRPDTIVEYLISSNRRLLFLDNVGLNSEWNDFQQFDLTHLNGLEAQKSKTVGGKAAMWGEMLML